MKKTTKSTIIAVFCAAVITAVGFLPAANAAGVDENNFSITKAYFAKHPTPVAKVDQTCGTPAAVENLGDGTEIRYFKTSNTMDLGYLTLVIRDGRVVDETFSVSLPSTPVKETRLAGR